MALSQSAKKWIFSIHQVLGLVTGVVVMLVALTGAGWAFKDEIEGFIEGHPKIDVNSNERMITASEAYNIAQELYPNESVHGTLFEGPGDPVEVILYTEAPEFYSSVFIHPYTGEVIGSTDHLSGFFAFMLRGHMYLWLPEHIGAYVVKYSILIFLLVLFSGLLLWIPKKGARARKQRLSFDWKSTTKWRRKNFDLHSITGFYTYVFAFTFAFTGSLMSFPWMYNLAFAAMGGTHTPDFYIPDNVMGSVNRDTEDIAPIDRLIPMLQDQYPLANSFELHYPHSESESIYVELENKEGVFYDNDYRFYDQYTLEEIPSNSIYASYETADFSDKVIRMNYDIHIGAIGGLAGKGLAFIASIMIASLPITGFLLFYGRRFKKQKNTVKSKRRYQLAQA